MTRLGLNTRPGRALSLPASLLLDMIRIAAALAVVVDHVSLQEFRLGTRDRQMWGFVAVPVFFVLSGFVIRHVAVTRESSLGEYLADRASRIYSVVLPALLVSVAAGGVCYWLNRQAFVQTWAATFHQPVQRLLINLLFLSQAWGLDTTPFLNVPFWSLGYECAYYVLFGCVFFLRGRQRVFWTVCVCAVAGPQVLLLLPAWALGCVVHDLYQRQRRAPHARLASAAVLLVLGAAVVLEGALRGGVPLLPRRLLDSFAGLPNPLSIAGLPVKHATMLALGAGLFTAPLLLLILLAVDAVDLKPGPWTRAVRRVADGTFALYLLHYPLLVVALFAGLLRPGRYAGAVAAICVVSIAVAPGLNALKRAMRGVLKGVG